jgi:hypothetical protein
MVTSVLSEDDTRNIRSYETSINQLFPPFKVPVINYTRFGDPFYAYIEKSHSYKSNYTQIVEAINRDMPIFQDKIEAALSQARNFSDQVLYRAPDVAAAFYNFFSIFGNLGRFVTCLSSPVVLAVIGFVIISFVFLPRCVPSSYAWIKMRRQKQTAKNQIAGRDNYGINLNYRNDAFLLDSIVHDDGYDEEDDEEYVLYYRKT